MEVLPLKIIVNAVEGPETLVVVTPEKDILVKVADLEGTGLREDIGKVVSVEGERYLSLGSVEGLKYRIDEKEAALVIDAEPRLFGEKAIDLAYRRTYRVTYTRANSAFLNYSFLYSTDEDLIDISAEPGVRAGDWLFTSTFDYNRTPGSGTLARLLSSAVRDDRKALTTLIVGDLTGASGPLGAPSLMGGVGFSRNFSIDPYFFQFPTLSLTGAIETPSTVEVYLDDRLIRTERVMPGLFTLKNIPVSVGYGRTRIIIRDNYGRTRTLENPYYFSDRLLKRGLHEYSYNAGFLREDFGVKSFSYSQLAFQAFHRYGFRDWIKAGYSLEVERDLISAGPIATLAFSNYGVLDAALSLSGSEGKKGAGLFFGYLFRSDTFNAALSMQALTRWFANLSTAPGDDKSAFRLSLSAGLTLRRLGALTAEYSTSRPFLASKTEVYRLLYDRPVSSRMNLFLTASRTVEEGTEPVNEFFAGLHVYFGREISGDLTYAKSGAEASYGISAQKNLPTATGYGFRADLSRRRGSTDAFFEGDYQNDYGVFGASYREVGASGTYQFTASGGIGYVDRSVFVSRPLTDSFAKVKVADLKGVRVRHFSNDIAVTGSDGSAIIPVINSYRDNRIDIEKGDIPLDYTIEETTKYINPPFRSGSVVEFKVRKIRAYFGKLYTMDSGEKVPVEFSTLRVILDGKVVEGLVGADGDFYIENITEGDHEASAMYRGEPCRFTVHVPQSAEPLVDLGEALCERQEGVLN